jgi:hypothetical protein
MEKLVIRIRLEALKKNLEQIRRIVESVSDRQNKVVDLLDTLESVNTAAYQIKTNVGVAKLLTSQSEEVYTVPRRDMKPLDITDQLRSAIESAESLSGELDDALAQAMEITREMKGRFNLIKGDFENVLREDATKKTKDWIDRLEGSIKSLDGAGGADADAALQTAWKTYIEIGNDLQRESVFPDYVNFLGGLAMRNTGLDDGICQIADKLIRDCKKMREAVWDSLAIPSYQEAVTLASVIRMGFPEWTIWALPLTAHEMGHDVISRNVTLKAYVGEQVGKLKGEAEQAGAGAATDEELTQRVQVCLADAFATCAMGPAYACALILLRLDPEHAHAGKGGQPPDAERAYVALSMLRKMSGAVVTHERIVEVLAKEWGGAVRQVTQPPEPGGAEPGEELNEEDAWLGEGRRRLLQEWVNKMGEYLNPLDSLNPRDIYTGTRLSDTRASLEALISEDYDGGEIGERLKEKLKVDGTEGWRDVLNAAWEYRMPGGGKKPGDADAIATQAHRLSIIIDERNAAAAKKKDAVKPGGSTVGRNVRGPGATSTPRSSRGLASI